MPSLSTLDPRNLQLARKAKKAGARYSLRIVIESRRAGIPISAGFALVDKESDFRNVFGHDSTHSIPSHWKGTVVTEGKYRHYKRQRPRYGMQGVGPTQLTWWEFQDRADNLGGCWKPRVNIRVGLDVYGDHYKKYRSRGHSKRDAMRLAARDYNGSGAAAEAYGRDFLKVFAKWHRVLD